MYGYGSELRKRGGKSWEPTLPVYTPNTPTGGRMRSGWFKCLIAASFTGVVLFILMIFFPCNFEAKVNKLSPPPEWTGNLAPNTELDKAERLFENQLSSPETVLEHKGHMNRRIYHREKTVLIESKHKSVIKCWFNAGPSSATMAQHSTSVQGILYAGTADGYILRIEGDKMRILTTFGRGPCGEYEDEPECGRPVSMRMSKDGQLYVIDAYHGLFRVNILTGDAELLMSTTTVVEGRACSMLSDLELDSSGRVYLIDSSRWTRRDSVYAMLEANSDGRLLRFIPRTREVIVLAGDLHNPSGMQLTWDENFLLLSEKNRARIIQYQIAGQQRGTIKVFADNLPGIPEKLRRRRYGGYWLAFSSIRRSDETNIFDFLATRPFLRSLLSRTSAMYLSSKLTPSVGLVAQLSSSGDIVRTLHDSNNTILSITHVEEDSKGALYFGSRVNKFIGRLLSNTK